jgi:hypothetical protein
MDFIENINIDASALAKKTIQVLVDVPVASWALVSGLYESTILNANITSAKIVDIIPLNSSISVVQNAVVLPETSSSSGAVKIYATNLPTAPISVALNIQD